MKTDNESKEGLSKRVALLEGDGDSVGCVTVLFGGEDVLVDVVNEPPELLLSWVVDDELLSKERALLELVDFSRLEDDTILLLELGATWLWGVADTATDP